MKVIIKCGQKQFYENWITKFFLENILPELDSEMAIESTTVDIGIHNKNKNKGGCCGIDHTVEVIVELTEDARMAALDEDVSIEVLKEKSGKFFDEALAIRKIEQLKPPFSREYYSCNYRRGTEGWEE